jgi:pyruvate dehydrogenase E2 component (dihydrolipoamide acetyltransferase)
MPIEILMPALSPTMTEGTLAKWLKNEGDSVASGDVIAEIETDKATMEVEAVDEGTLGKIMVPAGTANVPVNQVIALLLSEGEDKSALTAGPKPTAAPKPAAVAAAPVNGQAAPVAIAAVPVSHGDRVFASPLARRIAADAGIDLKQVAGSGPHGRIVKADIEKAKAGGVAPAAKPAPVQAPAATPAPAPAPKPSQIAGLSEHELVPHSTMRKVIAKRLTEAAQTIPHFYVTVDCKLDALMKLRADLNKRGDKDGFKLSVNDFVIRASALALRKMPDVNSAWSEEGMLRFKTVDVSVAVAIPAGLITPIIKNADQKGLAQISNEVKELVDRAKQGKLKPEEFQGGTFSVSNLGMFGVHQFTAIINPPQSCILAVGAGEQRAIVVDGAIGVQTMMSCTLSCDHRVVDGALGAQFLQKFKALIEDPLAMML